MLKVRAEVSLRLSFGGKAPKLDERAVRMLELIDQHGSIARAAEALGISYRTGWMLVNELRVWGKGSVVGAFRGGTINGSRLTPAGQALVERFRRTERELSRFLEQINNDIQAER